MNAIRMQLKLMLSQKSFQYTLLCGCLFSCVAFIVNCVSVFGYPLINVPHAYSFFIGCTSADGFYYIYMVLISLYSAVPFADSYFKEAHHNTLPAILSRISPKTYYTSKAFSVAASGFLVNFIPLLLNFLLNLIAFPIQKGCDFTFCLTWDSSFFEKESYVDTILFKDLFIYNPYVYQLFFLLFIACAGAVFALIVFNISFFVKQKKFHLLLLASMFLISCFLEIFKSVTDINIRLENYCFSFIEFEEFHLFNVIIMVILYLFFTLASIPFCIHKVGNIYENH